MLYCLLPRPLLRPREVAVDGGADLLVCLREAERAGKGVVGAYQDVG
jgi:hypothetical protein